jgi:hypothetical protein
MVLLQPYLDFMGDDAAQGSLRLKVWEYNSFLADPFFRSPDMSDAQFFWCQEYISKREAEARFPDQKIGTLFQSPNFKVRMGNFITKAEAEKFRLSINKLFPDGVFIVEDTIDYTPSKETEDNQ